MNISETAIDLTRSKLETVFAFLQIDSTVQDLAQSSDTNKI